MIQSGKFRNYVCIFNLRNRRNMHKSAVYYQIVKNDVGIYVA